MVNVNVGAGSPTETPGPDEDPVLLTSTSLWVSRPQVPGRNIIVTMGDADIPRRARAQDLDALVLLRTEMFHAMGMQAEDSAWRRNAREWFSARIEDALYGIFVLESSGSVVACGMGAIRDSAPSPAAPDGRDVLISNICTLPSHRGRGHGRAVLEAVMKWARQTGVGRAELTATSDGRIMYTQAGFAPSRFPSMRATLTVSHSGLKNRLPEGR